MKAFNFIVLLLVVIGAINWGLIGFFQINVISLIFGGNAAIISRVIYALVGLAGLWSISYFGKVTK